MMQQALWHDSLDDAVRTAVDALGGPKKVGERLWPAKPLEVARTQLLDCLNSDNPRKLSSDEFVAIWTWAAEAGCLVIADYLNRVANLEPPKRVDPETVKERQQREFIDAVQTFQVLAKKFGVTA